MSIEKVKEFLRAQPGNLEVIEIEADTHTSELAAEALGVDVAQIAKSLVFLIKDKPVMVVTCGDQKVNPRKIKGFLALTGKVSMAKPDKTKQLTGFPPGGVCPFALKEDITILLDKSLSRYPVVYAAAGTPHSLVPITSKQLEEITGGEIADLCS